MIIFGTRGVTTTRERGSFFCPQCGCERNYVRKRVRPFAHIYWIPLAPIGSKQEYIQCATCGSKFRDDVLEFDPQAAANEVRDMFHEALRLVAVHMTFADGSVDQSEIEATRRVVVEVTGTELSYDEIEIAIDEAQAAAEAGGGVEDSLRALAPRVNEHGKELLVRAALSIAAADGSVEQSELELVGRVASSLGMTPAHVRGLLAEITEPER